MEETKPGSGAGELGSTAGSPTSSSLSPPAASPSSPGTSVEEQSLQQTMDKNKESLKRKLMMRRTVGELRDQGIFPPLNTPPAFAEQTKHLERAKTGDILKQKLQHRPDRQCLVQHHILEDSTADPSIQDRQRMLKRARIQDSLSNSLLHRPGPLELVQGNILPADIQLRDALIEGKISYLKTSLSDDEDLSSDGGGLSSPSSTAFSIKTETSDASSVASSPGFIPTPPDITPLLQRLGQSPISSPPNFTFCKQSPVSFSGSCSLSPGLPTRSGSFSSTSSSGSSRDRLNRMKKNKAKTITKSKVIKFHEYKGPANKSAAPASPSPSPSPSDELAENNTAYNILLQQQQLFLKLQLESQKKLVMPQTSPTSLLGETQLGQVTSQSPIASTISLTSPTRFLSSSAVSKVSLTSSMKAPGAVQPVVLSSPQTMPKSVAIAGQPVVIGSNNTVTFARQPLTISGTAMTLTSQALGLQGKTVSVSVTNGSSGVKTIPLTSALTLMNKVAVPPSQKPTKALKVTPKLEARAAVGLDGERMSVDEIGESLKEAVTQPSPQVQDDVKPVLASVATPSVESVHMVLTNSSNASLSLTPSVTQGKCVTMTSGSTAASIAVPSGFKIVKLEEMKVSELKAELKKRNLTVSGTKPQLIERIKPHLGGDTLLISTACMNKSKDKKPDKSADVKSSPSTIDRIVDCVASAPTLQPVTPLPEDAMTLGSPPLSPEQADGSLCEMDGLSPTPEDKSELPMDLVHPSRPTSALSMDIDMETGLGYDKQLQLLPNSLPGYVSVPPTPHHIPLVPRTSTITYPRHGTSPDQRVGRSQQTAIVKPQQHEVHAAPSEAKKSSRIRVQSPVKATTAVASPVKSNTPVNTVSQAPIGQPAVITSVNLVRQQQEQIAQLVTQLAMSQRRLLDKEQALQVKTCELVQAQRQNTDQERIQQQLTQLNTLSAMHALVKPPSLPGVKQEVEEPKPAVFSLTSRNNVTPKLSSSNHYILTPVSKASQESSAAAGGGVLPAQPVLATQASVLTPHVPVLTPQASVLGTQSSLLTPQQTVLATQAPVLASTSQLPLSAAQAPVLAPVNTSQTSALASQGLVLASQAPVLASQATVLASQPTMLASQPTVLASQTPAFASQGFMLTSQPSTVTKTSHTYVFSTQTGLLSSQPLVVSSLQTPPAPFSSQGNSGGGHVFAVPQTVTSTAISNSRSVSVPSSPQHDSVNAEHNKLQRSSTNPGPLGSPINSLAAQTPFKAPPNYNEAIKNKQNQLLTNDSLAAGLLSDDAMDDVLEILLRNGAELPTDVDLNSTPQHNPTSSVSKEAKCHGNKTNPPNGVVVPTLSNPSNPADNLFSEIINTNSQSMEQMPMPRSLSPFITMEWDDCLNDALMDHNSLPPTPQVKKETSDPLGCSQSLAQPGTSSQSSAIKLENTDLGDMTLNMLGVSESDLTDSALSMDWLDAIMPQTSSAPTASSSSSPCSSSSSLTTVPPSSTSFSSDPILTPKPQDVLDLFNMDESDFYSPSDLGAGSFEKALGFVNSTS